MGLSAFKGLVNGLRGGDKGGVVAGWEKSEDCEDSASSSNESEDGSKAAVSGSATREDRPSLVNSSPKGDGEAQSAPGVEVARARDGNLGLSDHEEPCCP
eukprot:CAMPEP_0174283630 /NCGR_PEP_ID=MMETSP0809-20121228/4350_1 /TAXON_ID=73025 ORGANISM="Eutreptiella gymnastica-like, Strain CCMP1594" /NCGR_SAMPLE_ID=MMETSP0809 /ASSEMBLY_ACC=CAM_ASM_000658 /LENGTH=99 /DNA_ID=CAMNT_0015378691 /DNA_START=3702 /DNA_END=4000 /DNA_ORIENTATION=+